jgi:predicted RNA binding protein YcfA (HicA-like mRNA interferase family)
MRREASRFVAARRQVQLLSCACLLASHAIYQEHKRSEVVIPSQAGLDVLVLLLLLVSGQDLVRILASVGWSIGISSDLKVKDSHHSTLPESIDANVTMKIWRRLYAVSCCPHVASFFPLFLDSSSIRLLLVACTQVVIENAYQNRIITHSSGSS